MDNNLLYVPLERIKCRRPVDRLKFLQNAVAGKTVLDLGCLDETAYNTKRDTEFWLHGAISKTAKKIIGIDSSSLLDEHKDGLKPFYNSVIYKGNVFDLDEIINSYSDIDVVIAGELIEHLNNPMEFLDKIKSYSGLKGKTLILTTPNACSMSNIILGLFYRESTHEDHVNIFSYKTLNTICKKTKMKSWDIIPYYSAYTEMIENSRGIKKLVTIIFEKLTNVLQFCFPLLGGGIL